MEREEWGFGEILGIYFIFFVMCIFGGLIVAFNLLYSIVYFLLIFLILLLIRKILCTRCDYYGKWCSFAGGKQAACLFKQEEGEWDTPRAVFFISGWLLLHLYPIAIVFAVINKPFAYLTSIKYITVLYFVSIIVFHTVHMKMACSICKMKKKCPSGLLCPFK